MDTPNSPLRTALRYLVLGALICTLVAIAVPLGLAVLSAVGLSTDPHGYSMFAGILIAAVLTPVALALNLLHRYLRRRDKR
ncbi:hypothetical protein JOD54_004921 [Actinokineospora baliensis]|uniref:hypothetical protein n=1 Tax=Actinokineospora baliensis TaxID=547056 RepID=UPI00195DD62C|nr:hypothetical protein [Actinokineospora baliensis]MBM7774717.1 hypothetical protein [Actinokineospora baliensis]